MPEEKIRGLSVLFHLKLAVDLVLPNDSSGSAPEERTQRKHLWGRPQLADDLSLNLANTLTSDTDGPAHFPERMGFASSRGVSVFKTEAVCSLRFLSMTASEGEMSALSSIKSPR